MTFDWQRDPRTPMDTTPIVDEPLIAHVRPGARFAAQLIAQSDVADEIVDASAPGWTLHAPQLRGIDRRGGVRTRALALSPGVPQPLWLLLDIPLEAGGAYRVRIDIACASGAHAVELPVLVEGEPDLGSSEDDMHSLSRLAWLDSARGQERTVTAPYLPVAARGRTVCVLGREVDIGENGLPSAVRTHFAGINDRLTDEGVDMLDAPLMLTPMMAGAAVPVRAQRFGFLERDDVRASWRSDIDYGDFSCDIVGSIEFDGWMHYEITWHAARAVALDDIRLEYRPRRRFARWFSGIGTMATALPDEYAWRWDADKHQDGLFCGGMNGGVVLRPLQRGYVRPHCNIYYKQGPKNQPETWVNGGRGGFALASGEHARTLCYYTGALALAPGDDRTTDFDLGITPFKPVTPAAHYATRYYHAPGNDAPESWLDNAEAFGATHVIVHHAKDIYPYINYPMYDAAALGGFIRAAHDRGLRVKPYYTLRELTSRAPEFIPFLAFGDELLPRPAREYDGVPGQGEKDDYLREIAGTAILPAWKHAFTSGKYAGSTDPSAIVNPASRMANFFVEGLRWLCDRMDIDGIYIDDTGLDRHDMQRVRRVLDGHRPGAKIDLHSWDHFHDMWGESWGHNAVMYAELFPYIDSLWFGEGFDFNDMDPLPMLVECSGLPFGLMGEMLQGGGNPWRGLLFGMTARAGYQKHTPVKAVWDWRDEHRIADARMRGWWEEPPLVTASRADVLVTAYELPGEMPDEVAVVCASFAAEAATFTLSFADQPAEAYLPEIEGMQEGREVSPLEAFTVQPGGGVIVHFRR